MKQSSIKISSNPDNILHRLLKTESEIKICWLGNDGWLINHKDCLIAFDLELLEPYRLMESPVKVQELGPFLQYLFITHEHSDHFHDETVKILNEVSHCKFVLPESCLPKADTLGISEERRIIAVPGQPLKLQGLEAEPIRALHGHIKNSVYQGANLQDCGYILNLGGKRIYQPGDTVLLHEHLEMQNIDVLFVSPTEHNTQVIPSVNMIEAINPAVIIPQHYDTYRVDEENYFWTRGYVEELYNALPEEYKKRFIKLRQGEILSF